MRRRGAPLGAGAAAVAPGAAAAGASAFRGAAGGGDVCGFRLATDIGWSSGLAGGLDGAGHGASEIAADRDEQLDAPGCGFGVELGLRQPRL